MGHGKKALWTLVNRLKTKRKKKEKRELRDIKSRRGRRARTKCKKDNTLVIKTGESKYSKSEQVLKAMWSNAKLLNLGANVRSIRRTLTG